MSSLSIYHEIEILDVNMLENIIIMARMNMNPLDSGHNPMPKQLVDA